MATSLLVGNLSKVTKLPSLFLLPKKEMCVVEPVLKGYSGRFLFLPSGNLETVKPIY